MLFIEPLAINIKKNIPGPGHYNDTLVMNKYGIYNISTVESSKAQTWSPSKMKFYDEAHRLKKLVPGPGNYDPSDYSQGKYLLSSFKNYGTRKYQPDANKQLAA